MTFRNCLVRDKQQYILAMDFSYILCLVIFGVVAAEKCPANVTDLPYTTYHDELGKKLHIALNEK